MTAIVYESNTGYTKKYAQMLAKKTNLPIYDRKEAESHLTKGDEIIYMGWLCAESVKGYDKAAKLYNVKAVCGVGMRTADEKAIQDITARHHITDAKVFYMQGGFDMNKLRGMFKFIMKLMSKPMIAALEKKSDKTDEDAILLEMMKNGGDRVSEEHLTPVLEWLDGEREK